MITSVLTLFATVIILIYIYFKKCFNYWKEQGIPQIEPSFPNGCTQNFMFMKRSFGEQCKDFYDTYKRQGYKHIGFYSVTSPFYMPLDINLIKSILVSDFEYFVDRGVLLSEEAQPLSANLFSIEGERWKKMRSKLNPFFTSAKLKAMFPIVLECGYQMKQAVYAVIANQKPIDIEDVVSRFAINVIGSCAFGIECNCFEDKDSEFRKYTDEIFNPKGIGGLHQFLSLTFPELAKKLGISFYPKNPCKFYNQIIKQTLAFRESTKTVRKDLMQLLIDIKNSVINKDGNSVGLTYNELAAEAFLFFIAGNETSSMTLTFCLFELACNPDIQQKVRDEIENVLKNSNDEVTYDTLGDLKYTEQVIRETLRKYPVLTTLNRKCVKPYNIPGTDLILEKGSAVIIPVLAIHHNPEFFPEPKKFDPERFNEENKTKIQPCTYLPFGEGPRICIGARFGIMESKLGLLILIKNFKFSLNSKTKLPLVLSPHAFVTSSRDSIWLNAEEI